MIFGFLFFEGEDWVLVFKDGVVVFEDRVWVFKNCAFTFIAMLEANDVAINKVKYFLRKST